MKTHIARLLAVAVLVTAGAVCLQAQTRTYYVNFAYDADGNRVSRTITLGSNREDGDHEADTTAAVRYTDQIDECEISIYPNPTSDKVHVGMTPTEDGVTMTATLFSSLGVLITRREISPSPTEFDLSGMASGTYLLELRRGTETRTWKIIKR